ncbi:MAG: type I DNA topoisomerase [Clostridia bacterium]|nr:type I DNA topoisomerase [Clostridia bacterium]
MKLIIVESPNKANTIERWLGKEYKVLASGGHVRDLPESSFGVDVNNGFTPKYITSSSKRDIIAKMKKAKEKADKVYLATDPDREGEAISWHLASILKLDTNEENRIEFNEITEKAIKNALKSPRKIDMDLVNSQQARRVLDRIVGYSLSPIVCRKIQPKLSAGRVQSVALKLVVDREKEIKAFIPKEYWHLSAELFSSYNKDLTFKALYHGKNGKKITLSSKDQVDAVIESCNGAKFVASSVKKTTSKNHAPAPFTTSTLQQEGSNKLNFSSSITMRLAQSLYEGINIPGEGHVALITYIRTDSVRVSQEAQNEAKSLILSKFGKEYYPEKPNYYKSKNNAQDAHAAIRPISLERTPESLKGKLETNQFKLYKLIYERFLASQMSEAIYDNVNVDVNANDNIFKVAGKTLAFKGYLAAYSSYKEVKEDGEEENYSKLPPIIQGEILNLKGLTKEQKFTKPPQRYTDATLIKALEDEGIGRPSTYATILSVLLKRDYTEKEGKSIVPTLVAFKVVDFLSENFQEIMKVDFTANVEKELDEIENGNTEWVKVVSDFYTPFDDLLRKARLASVELTDEKCPKCGAYLAKKSGRYGPYYECINEDCLYRRSLSDETTDILCEKCGSKMVIKNGKFGKYLACSNYPDCSNTKQLEEEKTGVVCDKCGSEMIVKSGKYGKFLACSNYPSCKNIKPYEKPVAKCPICGKDVYLKKSKKGNPFYGCSGYPDCSFVSWDLPLSKKCPKCNSYLISKTEKNGAKTVKCSNKDCNFVERS